MCSENRSKISALGLSVEHDKKPELHHVLCEVTVRMSYFGPLVKSTKRMGSTRSWSDTKYYAEMEKNQDKVRLALETHFTDEEFSETIIPKMFSDLANSSDKIKIVSGSSKHDALLEVIVYYKTTIVGHYVATPETYVGARVKIKTLSGEKIYDRVFFSDRWRVTWNFLNNEIRSKIEKFIHHVVRKIRKDIIL